MATDPIEAFIAGQAPAVQPVIRQLRALVRATLPDVTEQLDGHGVIRYGHSTKMNDWLCYVSGHKAHANLGFARGASLPDPEGLVEGTGKNLRHVKVRSVVEATAPGLQRLLEEASRLGG
jgi:hypothetical protein